MGLWPIVNTSTGQTIEGISNCLLGFEDYPARGAYNNGAYCDAAGIDFKHLLLEATEKISKRGSGLCLNCVKKGKVMSADGNCRAASLELCTDFN